MNINEILGTEGDDRFVNLPGVDSANGMGGLDVIYYAGPRANYVAGIASDDYISGLIAGVGGPSSEFDYLQEFDFLQDVERAIFSDHRALAFDLGIPALVHRFPESGSAGDAFRLYEAALGRAPDLAGLGYWIAQLDGGARLIEVAQAFLGGQESRDVFGEQPTHAEFVQTLYANALHREADPGGLGFWVGLLDAGATTREQVLVSVTHSWECTVSLFGDDGTIGPPIEYIPWGW